MLEKFRRLFKKVEQNETDDRYVFVSEDVINEELKRRIVELERLGEEWSIFLQKKYANKFENQSKQHLRIWVCRDIDGEVKEGLNSEKCLEKEYRSQIVMDYDGPKVDDDFYAYYIPLWYYFGGSFKGSGTLYDLSKNNLESEIEDVLKILLKD
ncbi:hypothetical protein [Peribacillus simplex]|uniref:hypothetical protein n=1 Tax=Peribacillus simplex TaxID=1478 RepID=UPI0024C1307A|nr:hypothetical protein [Peribacillus simplex]WHY98553.1 hypothetical protein QNH37_05095 [Peribacillus simplex]